MPMADLVFGIIQNYLAKLAPNINFCLDQLNPEILYLLASHTLYRTTATAKQNLQVKQYISQYGTTSMPYSGLSTLTSYGTLHPPSVQYRNANLKHDLGFCKSQNHIG